MSVIEYINENGHRRIATDAGDGTGFGARRWAVLESHGWDLWSTRRGRGGDSVRECRGCERTMADAARWVAEGGAR